MPHSIDDFLNIRTASFSGFSPDGTKVLIASDLSGTAQLYRTSRTGGKLRQLTSYDEPVGGTYLPASDEVIFAKDEGGNERTQIFLMADDGSDVRVVAHDPDHIHRVGGVSRDGRHVAITSNRRNGVDFDVYVRDLASGDERLVFDMGGWSEAAGFSPDGSMLAVSRLTERAFDNDVYIIELGGGDVLHVCPHEEQAVVAPPSWLPDSSSFFFATDIGRDVVNPARYDLRTQSWEPILERDWNTSCVTDWKGTHLLVTTNEEGYTTIDLHDPGSLKLVRRVELTEPGIAAAGFSRDGSHLGISFTSPAHPSEAWTYDIAEGNLMRLTTSPNPVPTEVFVRPELHRFASFDGESIPLFLYRPRDAKADVPVVVLIHGGPESQYVPNFNAVVQYMVYRGYAVVAPNVRGSAGYGKRFVSLDDKRKRLDSVRDLESLYGWLKAERGIDHTRAALMGGSYGGYMVLAGLAFQPQLWAAGVDIVGISSFVTFLENTAPWRRKFREREYGSLEEDREFLVEASPLTHVDDIRAPLFIIHGTNDPRVPLGEAEQLHAALAEKGIATDLLVYGDEGHGLAKLKNRLDAYPKALDFLDRVLLR